jgi:hypothetical protein
VDPALLVEILENRFKVENLLKLNASFIYTPERRQENIYLGSLEVPTSRREVKLEEYHNLSWLMEPIEIYCQVLVEFAHDHIKVALAAALGDYRRRPRRLPPPPVRTQPPLHLGINPTFPLLLPSETGTHRGISPFRVAGD